MSYASPEAVLNMQWNAAQEAQITEQARRAPHVLMRPAIFPDGNAWCALYGEDLQSGVAGFGDTPSTAAADFDLQWSTQKVPPSRGVQASDDQPKSNDTLLQQLNELIRVTREPIIEELGSLYKLAQAGNMGEVDATQACEELRIRLAMLANNIQQGMVPS